MIEFQPFADTDWAYARNHRLSAEPFPDGVDPLAANLNVEGIDALAIIDLNGLQVTWEAGRTVVYTFENSARAAVLLRASMTLADLRDIGGAEAT